MVAVEADLGQLRGSKYLQSSTENTFQEARAALDAGRRVLYSGTPCQIAGLYAFLGSDCERLITLDVLCHGVPSPKVFARYIQHLEARSQRRAVQVAFRDKRHGWRRFSLSVEMEDGTVTSTELHKDPYLVGFLRNLYLRPACGECPYTRSQRIGDLTLGDFWGIGGRHPEMDDGRGVSEVLINTPRGQALFEACSDLLYCRGCPLQAGIQGVMQQPSAPSPQRSVFFRDLDRLSFGRLRRRYLRSRQISAAKLLGFVIDRARRMVNAVVNP
jgi:coenzyme F420-reducing hydrogenase beta subunit